MRITGELKEWHKVNLVYTDPSSSETATLNLLSDFDLEVTFTNGSSRYVGYPDLRNI